MIKGIHHVAFKCETQEQFDEMIYFYFCEYPSDNP